MYEDGADFYKYIIEIIVANMKAQSLTYKTQYMLKNTEL